MLPVHVIMHFTLAVDLKAKEEGVLRIVVIS